MKLRGKKVFHEPVDKDFTKIPNELFGIKMNHVDKLVLMRLYYHDKNYVLAYTRLAQELSIGKTTIKESWKRLKENGYIIENGEYYIINLKGTGNDPNSIGTASGHKQTQSTGNDHSMVQQMDIPESASDHGLVQETTLIGTADVPNEEDTKEEDELNKTKEEPLDVGDCVVVSDSATTPDGVAPSSPPQPQLSDKKKKSISKYTSDKDECVLLQDGFSEYQKRFPDSNLTFSNYEDLLMYTVHRIELASSGREITNSNEIFRIISPQGLIKSYNSNIIFSLSELKENRDNIQEKFKRLRQQFVKSS